MAQVKRMVRDDTAEFGYREELTTVKVGDYVGFKCDIEQYGRIVEIDGDNLTLESAGGFHGDYIGGQTHTVETADRCWTES